MSSHTLLNIRLDDLSDKELDQTLLDYLNGTGQKMVVTPNPEFLLLARRDKGFAEILNRADLSLPDGAGLEYAVAALTDNYLAHRHAGVDTLERLARLAVGNHSILLLGAPLKNVAAAAEIFKQKYPEVKIRAFDPDQVSASGGVEEKIISEIKNFSPIVLAVGLGQGKQERFIAQYLSRLPSVRIAIGVGGAFDIISGHLPRAPRFMRQMGLEWLWRLFKEPQRWPRIFRAVIVFPLQVTKITLIEHKFWRACGRTVKIWLKLSNNCNLR